MFLSDRSIVSVSMPGMLFAADPVLARFCFALVGTVAQKIAPMFACYGKTHALLNDYIR